MYFIRFFLLRVENIFLNFLMEEGGEGGGGGKRGDSTELRGDYGIAFPKSMK